MGVPPRLSPRLSSRGALAARSGDLEEALVRTVHWRVGGPAALSLYDDPAAVRDAVLLALAGEQRSGRDRARVQAGDLTPLERRVVRTVTNRGAAVRSRERQRREIESLRAQLADRDHTIRQLRAQVEAERGPADAPAAHAPPPAASTDPPDAPPAAAAARTHPPDAPLAPASAPAAAVIAGSPGSVGSSSPLLTCAAASWDGLPPLASSLDSAAFHALADPLN